MKYSKFIKANEKIAENLTSGFHKIEDTVVGGYTKIENRFVESFLIYDGETLPEAKERLKKK